MLTLGTPLKASHLLYPACRLFSTTAIQCGHYETLSLPKNASKTAVKASFYKLSKKYHPDVNSNDKGAKEKFQAVSEAYSVLGDDRRRRAYDHELSTGASSASTASHSSQTPPHRAYYYDPWSMYETRRRGASYAWESPRRRSGRTSHHPPPPPHYAYGRSTRPNTEQHQQSTRDPFSSPHVRRATGSSTPWEAREDRLKREPGAVRVAQVMGIVFFIMVLGGGFSASAG